MFQVYFEDGTQSKTFNKLIKAQEAAHRFDGWFEIVDLSSNSVVYTAENYKKSSYYYAAA
jgi:hypothetical protein